MNKKLIAIGIILVFLVVGISGCSEQQNEKDKIQSDDNTIKFEPVASCSASSNSGVIPFSVNFIGVGTDSDGNIESYYWDFGDGTTSNQQNPTHTFYGEGVYLVTLTVTDDDGMTDDDTITITAIKETINYVLELLTKIPKDGRELTDLWEDMSNYDIPEDKDKIVALAEIGQSKAKRYMQDIEDMNLPTEYNTFLSRCREYYDYWEMVFYYIDVYCEVGGSENLDKSSIYMGYVVDALEDVMDELYNIYDT